MTTNRRPINRRQPPGGQTDRALKLFEGILFQADACNCEIPDTGGRVYWAHDCEACKSRVGLDADLHKELKLEVWDFPAVSVPGLDYYEAKDPSSVEARERYNKLLVLLIDHKKDLLRTFLARFPKKRRDGVAYRQTSAEGDKWESAPFEEGMMPGNGWLTLADLEAPQV